MKRVALAPLVAGLACLAACGLPRERTQSTSIDSSATSPESSLSSRPTATPLIPDSLELQALGNEPFWSVTVSREGMIYRDPERLEGIVFPAARGQNVEGRWIYRSSRPDSVPSRIEVVIEESPCSDGMSDERYRFTSHVQLDERHFDGCARLRPLAR